MWPFMSALLPLKMPAWHVPQHAPCGVPCPCPLLAPLLLYAGAMCPPIVALLDGAGLGVAMMGPNSGLSGSSSAITSGYDCQ